MIAPGTTWRNPRTGATLMVVEHTPQSMVVERLMRPGTGRTDAHVHRDFAQWWEAVEGELTCAVDGRVRRAAPGEHVEVPSGTPHEDPRNEGEADLRFRF